MEIRKHPITQCEVSFIELIDDEGKKFKVTRRIPELNVAETKIFISKEEARKQFEEWLR